MIVLIESPYKAAPLQRVFREIGFEAKIVSTNGRLFDLPFDSFGITRDFKVSSLEPVNAEHFDAIKPDLLNDSVIVCTDADEEGDFIAWTIDLFRKDKKTFRSTFQEFTKEHIRASIDSASIIPSQEPPSLARRLFDRLVGYSSNDGMFLSRTAGALLGAAASHQVPVEKTVQASIHPNGVTFNEEYLSGFGSGVHFEQPQSTQTLPNFAHCLHLAPEIGCTPKEMFDVLQRLYAESDISYFRTESTALNQTAQQTLDRLEFESGFLNLSRAKASPASMAHPGIYSTRYPDSQKDRATRGRRSTGLQDTLRARVFNATVFAMSDPDGKSVLTAYEHGKAYKAAIGEARGDTYSYPMSRFSLDDDIVSGSPRRYPASQTFTLDKESSIALTLIRLGVSHPSSWVSLANRYACFLTQKGTLSERGAEFHQKHKRESPLLLESEISLAIESTLLNPVLPVSDKLKKALALAEIPEKLFGSNLEPSQTPDPEAIFTPRSP
jgi:hypothetical protein